MPVTSPAQFQHVFCLARTHVLIVKDEPILVVNVGVGNLLEIVLVVALDPRHVVTAVGVAALSR